MQCGFALDLVAFGCFQDARADCDRESGRLNVNSMLICIAAVRLDILLTFLCLLSGSSSLHVTSTVDELVCRFGGRPRLGTMLACWPHPRLSLEQEEEEAGGGDSCTDELVGKDNSIGPRALHAAHKALCQERVAHEATGRAGALSRRTDLGRTSCGLG